VGVGVGVAKGSGVEVGVGVGVANGSGVGVGVANGSGVGVAVGVATVWNSPVAEYTYGTPYSATTLWPFTSVIWCHVLPETAAAQVALHGPPVVVVSTLTCVPLDRLDPACGSLVVGPVRSRTPSHAVAIWVAARTA
jgi:hypothetical protein